MKKLLIAALLIASATASAQQVTNKYAMKLTEGADGTYTLNNQARYAKILDLSKVPDLLVPYTHQNDRLSGKDYKNVEVREFVYTTHEGYELQMAVDMAVSDKPTPVVVYIHGGGWARGDNGANRSLSQYMAKQKGVTGVRIAYTLAPQPDATVEVSIADVKAAVQYLCDHAGELNLDMKRIGFVGTSAGGHLAAVGAMSIPGVKALVGYSGIYNLEVANIVQKTKDDQRIEYFCDRSPKVLREASPISLIPKKNIPAVQLFAGTGDTTVEYSQAEAFAAALKKAGAKVVDLEIYPLYDHGLNTKSSDKMEEIFFKTVDFLSANL